MILKTKYFTKIITFIYIYASNITFFLTKITKIIFHFKHCPGCLGSMHTMHMRTALDLATLQEFPSDSICDPIERAVFDRTG